jgi:membrane protein DedA with SNARE-associated domain
MWEEILKSIPVFLSSTLKFILGPISGYAEKLNILATILATIGGMMTSVIIFTYFGEWMRTKVLHGFFGKTKKQSEPKEKFVSVWSKYGLAGIAALTPVILTPIGGTILAVSSGSPKNKIIFYMLISATIWSVIFTLTIYFFGHQVLPDWVK